MALRRRVAATCLFPVVILGFLLAPAPVAGQDVTESSLKAAFIHNFIRFTEWPRDALQPAAPLALCVLGDRALGDVLANYVKGRPVDGHDIVVTRIAADGMLPLCHLLYVSGVTASQAAQVTAGLSGAAVLTLSDVEQFAQVGGMAQFYFEEGRLRFRINLDNARRGRLQLSSKLLSLAKIVKGDPNAIAR